MKCLSSTAKAFKAAAALSASDAPSFGRVGLSGGLRDFSVCLTFAAASESTEGSVLDPGMAGSFRRREEEAPSPNTSHMLFHKLLTFHKLINADLPVRPRLREER